ncbi:hypothetical protein TNCV_1140671 [Trichonephila clavipes]|nr:hypothetical protein TNCV_1140671 [Trichonephila clavipes]
MRRDEGRVVDTPLVFKKVFFFKIRQKERKSPALDRENWRATGELLTTGLLILNHGQVTRRTTEFQPLSPFYHTTPTGGHLSLDTLTCIGILSTAGLKWYQTRIHDMLANSP